MVAPIIWGAVWLGSLALGAWGAREVGDMSESVSKVLKWGAIGGGIYVSYVALKSTGVLK